MLKSILIEHWPVLLAIALGLVVIVLVDNKRIRSIFAAITAAMTVWLFSRRPVMNDEKPRLPPPRSDVTNSKLNRLDMKVEDATFNGVDTSVRDGVADDIRWADSDRR